MTELLKLQLLPPGLIAATVDVAAISLRLDKYRELTVTWDITVAERDSADETYDLYITTGDGISSWDLIHFPQIATTGAKRYTAKIRADLLPQTVASNGTASNEGILLTSSTNAIKTLAAGSVRHGNWGSRLGYSLVIAGTVATGINSSVQVEAR